MRKVKVEAAVYTVVSGILGLSAEQARTRLHCLRAVKTDKSGGGTYEVLKPVQFKRGEEFGFSGEVGKNGELSDPEAEEIKRMEQAETLEKAVAAERARLEAQFQARFDKALAEAKTELEAKIRAELQKAS